MIGRHAEPLGFARCVAIIRDRNKLAGPDFIQRIEGEDIHARKTFSLHYPQ